MGYAAEKRKADKQWTIFKVIVLFIFLVVVIFAAVFSYYVPSETWKFYFDLPKLRQRADGELRIHFVDVGQGDATLVELPDGKTLLIDGGNGTGETEKTLMRYLNALDVDKIDYLVLTHADSDHCGALDIVIKYKEIGKVFLPVTDETVNGEYARFYARFVEKGCDWEYSKCGIMLGTTDGAYPYTLSFLHPYSTDKNVSDVESNEQSAVLWLDYNGISTLFTGDIPQNIETLLTISDGQGLLAKYGVDLTSTEILKVAHHGSADSTSTAFL